MVTLYALMAVLTLGDPPTVVADRLTYGECIADLGSELDEVARYADVEQYVDRVWCRPYATRVYTEGGQITDR